MIALALTLSLALGARAQDEFARGVEAYRAGDYAAAEVLWRTALEGELAPLDRARVLHDLGNAAWRRGEPLAAVGAYTAALRLDPRRADTRANLELARAKAGLEPADRGDLRSALERALSALRPPERRLFVLAALAVCAALCVLEALRGGRGLRAAALASLALAALLAVPLVVGLARGARDPWLVLGAPSVPLRSEPRADLEPVGEVAGGDEVERVDALPGWVRVATRDGARGWVPEDALFDLSP